MPGGAMERQRCHPNPSKFKTSRLKKAFPVGAELFRVVFPSRARMLVRPLSNGRSEERIYGVRKVSQLLMALNSARGIRKRGRESDSAFPSTF